MVSLWRSRGRGKEVQHFMITSNKGGQDIKLPTQQQYDFHPDEYELKTKKVEAEFFSVTNQSEIEKLAQLLGLDVGDIQDIQIKGNVHYIQTRKHGLLKYIFR